MLISCITLDSKDSYAIQLKCGNGRHIDCTRYWSSHWKVSSLFSRGNAIGTLRCVAKAADSLCDGDLVEKKIRSSQNWGLLPLQVWMQTDLPVESDSLSTENVVCNRWLSLYTCWNVARHSTRALFLVSTWKGFSVVQSSLSGWDRTQNGPSLTGTCRNYRDTQD